MNLKHISFAAIALTLALPPFTYAETITIKPGETLSEISTKYQIPIDTILRLNGIQNPNQIPAGFKLKLPNKTKPRDQTSIHLVAAGESISSISKLYSIDKNEIIKLNNLPDENYLYINQKIKLPQPSINSNAKSTLNPIKKNIKTKFHIVMKGETLSQIAEKYRIPLKKLMAKNDIVNPNELSIGEKLFIDDSQTKNTNRGILETRSKGRQSSNKRRIKNTSIKKNKSEWRSYGPLSIDWANWQPMEGSYIAPTINQGGKALYIAINCTERKINATGLNGVWKDWSSPIDRFEFNLINDLCNSINN